MTSDARRVELVLPETGVCNRTIAVPDSADIGANAAACCGVGAGEDLFVSSSGDAGRTPGHASGRRGQTGRACSAPAMADAQVGIVAALSVTETVSWGVLY